MRFPSLTLERTLQIDDKTRLNASLSFTSGETITDIEIEPEVGEGYISVFNSDSDKWYLDWAYEVDGGKTASVRITTDIGTKTKSYDFDVLTIEDDSLFSDDNDLFPHEPDIVNFLPSGKNSWLFVHRKAQERILAYLDEQRIWHDDGTRYTKAEIATITDDEVRDQFRQWSVFQTLLIIFESLQVSVGDRFQEKKEEYMKLRDQSRNRASLRLDQDKDEVLDDYTISIRSTRLVRR